MIFVLVLAALTAFVAAPLYGRPPRAEHGAGRRELQARLDVLLAALRELEIDHRTGSLGDAEFGRQRSDLEDQAARVLAELGD